MSERRRLLMTADTVGGVWSYAVDLASALVPLGFDTTIAVLGPAPSAAQREGVAACGAIDLVETGLPLDWLAEDAASVRLAGARIAALAAECRADLTHLNQPALASGWSSASPLIVAVHSCVATWWDAVEGGAPPPQFEWQTALVREGLVRADALVVPSHAFAEIVRRSYGLVEGPAVVHNGRSAGQIGTGCMEQVVLTAGRLWDRGKNLATLDRVASRMSVALEAAGSLVAPHGERIAPRHIRALGHLAPAELAARYARRPIFVSAALYEPFGLAVLEAAQAGCALVLADIPTFRELWTDAALFVDPRDPDAFLKTLETLLNDAPAREHWSARAADRAANYSVERMALGTAALYDQVLTGGRTAARAGTTAGGRAAA